MHAAQKASCEPPPDICGGHAHAWLLHPGGLLRGSRLLRLLLAVGLLRVAPAGRLIRPPLPLVHGGMRHNLNAQRGTWAYELGPVGSITSAKAWAAQHSS